ncbi:cytidine deaminase [Bradymonas sediminis]|uniref:Cytidine deaminase n=1 Tax=Bradymonas sediminis TaxID=1548548 RepID=A0A2Z4FP34_9DELT|nr:cytidine deaminase [Bradymonas sediminis]AWV90801.1 cytidine deaminase [Bradymonas sediminis]TDP75465.1 cytidine deaminase [Bradymonas sediminis]
MADRQNSTSQISEQTWDALYKAAAEARERAYAPYSEFLVGAALLMESGDIYAGGNVENASYGATICAERSAICSAVAGGARRASALLVITDTEQPAAPCGICRQVLSEFSDDLPIMMANTQGQRVPTSLDALLPFRFGKADLDK